MGEVFGYELVAQALKNEGADTMFFIMGGPMLGAQDACRKLGIRMIDVRHEQAAAMMGNAYARLTGKAGLCSTASGPAATNLLTGLAHALTDAAPIIALGGASPIHQFHTEAFQEVDQLSMMRPAAKWAGQAISAKRIPDYINTAYRHAMSGRRGPAYLDLPGDVLYSRVNEDEVVWPRPAPAHHRVLGDPGLVQEAVNMLARAQRPVHCVWQWYSVVGCLCRTRTVRQRDRHPLLHHPAGTGRGAGRPSPLLPQRPQSGVS